VHSTALPNLKRRFHCQYMIGTAKVRVISICRSTASRSPVLTRGGICVPPTVTYLPYRVSDSTLTAVGRSQLLTQWPGTLSRILFDFIRDPRAAQTALVHTYFYLETFAITIDCSDDCICTYIDITADTSHSSTPSLRIAQFF